MSQDIGVLLKQYYLNVVGNGFYGHTNQWNAISVTKKSAGSYTISGSITFMNEPTDQLAGTIKGRHIVFTRTRPGVFVQTYDGWVFEKQYKQTGEMAGKITADGKTEWGWYGWLELLAPK